MKQFYALAQEYVRPFSTDGGVAKYGDDLRLLLNTKVGKESVRAIEIECISGQRGTTKELPSIVVKVVRGMGVRVVEIDQ